MVPLYMVIGEKCNFCTYIVGGAPNGPSIQADFQKVQFLHLHYQWCSKWSTYTWWLGKSAISAPTLLLVLQMVPLCWLTKKKCNFCTYILTGAPNSPPIYADWYKMQFLYPHCQWCSKWSPYTGWLGKSAISAPTLLLVLQMVPHTCWLAKSAISVPTLSVVLQMVPLYRLTGLPFTSLPFYH